MRKLKLQVQMSVDGFVAGPNGEMDWMTWDWDEGIKNYVSTLTRPVDTILLGRVLAQGFINHWSTLATNPDTTDDFSRKMHESLKIVFTKTLDSNEWENTSLEHGDLVASVNAVKEQPGGDIIAYGGGNFVSNLIKNDLIDDYHLFVNPAAVGKGMPIFQGLESVHRLKLVEARPFECGITVMHYKRSEK